MLSEGTVDSLRGDSLREQPPFAQTGSQPLAYSLEPRARHNEAGFTLAELVIAICLIGLIATIVLPRIDLGTNTLSATSRQLISTIRTLYITASTTKRWYRLYFDLDQQTYWAVVVQPDGERPPPFVGLAQRVTLPPEIRLMDVITPQQGKVATMQTVIQFMPGGRTERSILHLSGENGKTLTVLLNPMTGGIQIMDGYVEPQQTEPIPETIKAAFFPPSDLLGPRPFRGS